MAEVETTHIFEGTPAQCFAAIRQYDKYPEYIPGVIKIEVLPAKAKGSVSQVRYEINVVKTFFYTLNAYEEAPRSIRWELDESNLMKANSGEWILEPHGKDKTKATYKVDVAFRGLVPSAMINTVTKANMPGMFAGFQKLIDATKAKT